MILSLMAGGINNIVRERIYQMVDHDGRGQCLPHNAHVKFRDVQVATGQPYIRRISLPTYSESFIRQACNVSLLPLEHTIYFIVLIIDSLNVVVKTMQEFRLHSVMLHTKQSRRMTSRERL